MWCFFSVWLGTLATLCHGNIDDIVGNPNLLVVWNVFLIFPYIAMFIIPIYSYFSEGWLNHQPANQWRAGRIFLEMRKFMNFNCMNCRCYIAIWLMTKMVLNGNHHPSIHVRTRMAAKVRVHGVSGAGFRV